MYIVSSIGPKFLNEQYIKNIIENGSKYLRVSFSHLKQEEIIKIINFVRNNYANIGIIGDLQGNKIRVSNKLQEVFKVNTDEEVYFCGEDGYEIIKGYLSEFKEKIIPLNIKGKLLYEGDIHTIYMKDGTMKFKVLEKKGELIKAIVKLGGVIRKEKGCNIPKINRNNMSLTEKDKDDIRFCVENNIDKIVYSYTCYEKNIQELRNYISTIKDRCYIPVFSKIETLEGIDNFDEILKLSDGIILGRGDLLPESNIYMLPILQKKIISKMKCCDKDLIIATHILDSMKNDNIPTVNEVEGIFNFALNKVNGLLLAGETSVGNNPFKTVKILNKFICYYENILNKI